MEIRGLYETDGLQTWKGKYSLALHVTVEEMVFIGHALFNISQKRLTREHETGKPLQHIDACGLLVRYDDDKNIIFPMYQEIFRRPEYEEEMGRRREERGVP